jgi:hypothetical protein
MVPGALVLLGRLVDDRRLGGLKCSHASLVVIRLSPSNRRIVRRWDCSGMHQKFRPENMIRPGSYFCLVAVS